VTAEHVAIQNYACPHCHAVFRTAFQRCPLDGYVLEELSGDPLAGSSFADRYVIEECVGEGGMGRVYRARHQRMSRLFAVKVLFGDHAADTKMRQRLAREAEAASRLSHPNVISVVDFGETEAGLLYLVMDYIDGPTLAQVVEREAPLQRERVIRIARDCARGLAHAHSKGLIHRDFKADNVLITEDSGEEVAKIVDFGIAMLNEPSKSRKLTTEGMVLGTPAVMAPEQAVGEKVDHRTDLFSLGIVMYEMMAGVLPFDGSPLEIARQNLASRVPRIADRVPGLWVDPELEALAVSLMAKRPEDRPQRAKDVLKALSRIEGESSREFRRAEAPLLENDPLTPIPGRHDPVDSWPVDDPTEITPYPPRPDAIPDNMTDRASAPNSAPAAYTEMVSLQGQAKRPNSSGALIAIGAALVLLAVLVVVLASRESSTDAASTKPVAGTDESGGEPTPGDKAGVADAGTEFVDPGEIIDEADAAPAVAAAPDAAPEPDVAGADEARKRRAEIERRRKERAERRRKERIEAERARRERIEAERVRKEDEARKRANAEITREQFLSRYNSVGQLLNRLARVDKGLAKQLRGQYGIVTNQLSNALRDPKARRTFYNMLGRIRGRANRAMKDDE
jgi:serine/threonine protein kinase